MPRPRVSSVQKETGMTNQNGNPESPLHRVVKGIQEVMLTQLEEDSPGARKIIEDLESEVTQLIESYDRDCLTEIHALRLVDWILHDLEHRDFPMMTKARALVLETYHMVLRLLVEDYEGARERWYKRHETKEELRGVQQKSEGGDPDSGAR
jgi:hypothetical protein